MSQHKKTLFVVVGAVTAALYVALTMLSAALGLSSGVIQFRVSEALCVLPAFSPAAIGGLFVGCLIANLLAGGIPMDIIFGSLATLIGAVGAYLLRRHRWLTPLPTVIANMLIVPPILRFCYQIEGALPFFMLTVGIGELVCCYVGGIPLYYALYANRDRLKLQ